MTNPSAPIVCSVCTGPTRAEPFFYDWHGVRRLFRCASCTHQFVHPPISGEERAEIFSDSYFEAGGDVFDGFWSGGYEDELERLMAEAREVLGLLPGSPRTLLDIGCAGGVFLKVAADAGLQVQGIELNDAMAERARRRGLEVLQGAITEIDPSAVDAPFDVITLMDVLEHVPQPREVMERVAAWTREGSILLIRGPLQNERSAQFREWLRRVVRAEKRLPGYPLDANAFSKRSLARLVTSYGFRIEGWPRERPGFANLIAVRT